MPAPTLFLIGQPAGTLTEALFLYVFDDGEDAAEMEWLPDRTRALRFGSPEAAERFASMHRLGAVEVSGHAASELVSPVHRVPDRSAVA